MSIVDGNVRGIPNHLPQMAVRIVEIPGVAAVKCVPGRLDDHGAGAAGLIHHFVDFLAIGHIVADGERRRADRPSWKACIMSDTETNVPLPDLEKNGGVQPFPESTPAANGEDPDSVTRSASDLEAVFDVPVQVSAVLGRARMDVGELLKLGPGAVLELDRKVGEAIDIYINNRLVARGEVVLVEDKLGVTMTEIIKAERN